MGRNHQPAALLKPADAIADRHGMSARCDLGADLHQMQVHGLSVGMGMMIAAPTARLGQIAPKM